MNPAWFCIDDDDFQSALSKLQKYDMSMPDDPQAAVNTLHNAMYGTGWTPRPVETHAGYAVKAMISRGTGNVDVLDATAASAPCAMTILLAKVLDRTDPDLSESSINIAFGKPDLDA